MISFLQHLFLPHHSNNHRPKLLHHKSLFSLVLIVIILATGTFVLRKTAPNILGVATDIAVEDLFSFTNEKRQREGLPPLVLSSELTEAAKAKALDMFTKDYWAHSAPDGTTPWVFIQSAGYQYIYAGENLAKDFSDSKAVVAAWTASPSHRENMLSAKYKEIGFAVVNGRLKGEETTLVVEMFGSKETASLAKLPNKQNAPAIFSDSTSLGVTNSPLINSASATKRIAFFILAMVFIAFTLDLIYTQRQKLVRLVGHNSDHLLFLTRVLFLLVIFGKGMID